MVTVAKDSVLLRRSSVMLSGVVAAKGATVIALLVLARLYTPDAFGLFGLFQAVFLVVSVIATLGYTPAIALPERCTEAAAVVWLCLLLLAATSIGSAVVVMILGDVVVGWMDSPVLRPYLIWVPLHLSAYGAYEVLAHWATRRREFSRLAASTATVAVAVAVCQIGWFVAGEVDGGLIVGAVLGTLIGAVILASQTWATDGAVLVEGRDWAAVQAAARGHGQFPRYHAPAALVTAVSASLVPVGLGYLFGPIVVGLFWMADRVCGYLATLIRQALQQVFLNRAVEVAHAGGDVSRLFKRTTWALSALGAVPTIVFAACGPALFGLVFGPEWVAAGEFARWLAVAWLFGLINIPAVQLTAVYHRQRWALIYSLGLAVCRAAAIGVGSLTRDPTWVMGMYAAGNAVCSSTLVFVVYRHVERSPSPLPVSDRSFEGG